MASSDVPMTRQGLIDLYNREIRNMAGKSAGQIRSAKGSLVENLALDIAKMAWLEAGGELDRLSFGDIKRYRIPIQQSYIDGSSPVIKDHIDSHKSDYIYRAHVDVHVFVDGCLVMGIECKSYAENAMLKRVLLDYRFLKLLQPKLTCCLLQLESQLTGNYSNPLAEPQFGSASSHTIMSYFPNINLQIITLLRGERKPNQEIHKPEYYKPLHLEVLDHAINRFSRLLSYFV